MKTLTLLLVSALVCLAAAIAWWAIGNAEAATKIADYVGTVVASLAFLWLIAGYRLQSEELRLQRTEIELQRKAIQEQGRDTHELARLGVLSQVGAMLNTLNESIPRRGINQVSSVYEIMGVLAPSMTLLPQIIGGKDAEARFNAYLQWSKIEGAALQFLGCGALAIRLCAPYDSRLRLDGTKDDAELVARNGEFLATIPPLQPYALALLPLAQLFFRGRKRLLTARLAGLRAAKERLGDAISDEEIERLRREVDELPDP